MSGPGDAPWLRWLSLSKPAWGGFDRLSQRSSIKARQTTRPHPQPGQGASVIAVPPPRAPARVRPVVGALRRLRAVAAPAQRLDVADVVAAAPRQWLDVVRHKQDLR